MEDLQRVYSLLSNEITKVQHKIDGIDRTIENCDRLNREYWCDVRAERLHISKEFTRRWISYGKNYTSEVMCNDFTN